MNLNARLSKLSQKAAGLPTLADQFKGVSDADVRSDVAAARQGKTMSLSGRAIGAADEVKAWIAA